jgi:hypothetical protein
MMAAGFLAVMSLESVYFTLKGLGPLYNFHLNADAAIAVNSSGECSTSQAYYPGVILSRGNMAVFGPYFLLFIPSMVYAAIKRERGGLTFIAWAGVLLLILQFGFVSFSPPIRMVKVRKFLNFATVPLVMTAAYALMSLRARYRIAVVIVVAALSLYLIRAHTYSHRSTPETWGGYMRGAGTYLEQLPPKTIYADGRTSGMLRLATDYRLEADRFVDLYKIDSADELENCYVVINKFYASFDQRNPFADVPDFLKANPPKIPPHWKGKDFLLSAVYDVP